LSKNVLRLCCYSTALNAFFKYGGRGFCPRILP
jgi:hypothetical protein